MISEARALAAIALSAALSATGASHARAQGTRANPSAAADTIRGRVLDEAGRPFAGAVVLAHGSGTTSRRRVAWTDEEGRFEVSGLEPGLYRVEATAPARTHEPDVDPARARYRPGDDVTLCLVLGGAITGTVRGPNGEPLVGTLVHAVLVRSPDGKRSNRGSASNASRTDDRGVYRIYGLAAGTYVVSAGGAVGQTEYPDAYSETIPTYHPSATASGATPIKVRLGEETAGIDIYYREIHGHTVAGRIAGASADGSYVRVALRSAATGVGVEDATAEDSPRGPTFRFEDVPDGAYEVVAESWGDKRAISLPRRVEVSGSAVEGLELVLSPLNAIAGRIVVEPARGEPPRACPALRHVLPHEIALELTAVAIDATWRGMWREDGSGTVASREGAFSFEGLLDGRFAIGVGLPDAAWYVQSVSLPAERRDARGAAERQDASGPIRLAGGAHREGLEVVVAHGAASVRGRVAPSNDIRVRVHLLPAEPERAEDVLRYREVAAEPDGTFSLRNVAPGRYRLVAALAAPQAQSESSPPAAWNPKRRDELRRAAESSGLEVELSPCQRAEGLELRLAGTSAVRQLRSGSVE